PVPGADAYPACRGSRMRFRAGFEVCPYEVAPAASRPRTPATVLHPLNMAMPVEHGDARPFARSGHRPESEGQGATGSLSRSLPGTGSVVAERRLDTMMAPTTTPTAITVTMTRRATLSAQSTT